MDFCLHFVDLQDLIVKIHMSLGRCGTAFQEDLFDHITADHGLEVVHPNNLPGFGAWVTATSHRVEGWRRSAMAQE